MPGRKPGLAPLLAALAILVLGGAETARTRDLILAATTSVRDSGLLDDLLPTFTKRTGIAVRVVAAEGGAALEMARRGDADIVISNEPDAEIKLVEDGQLTARRPFVETTVLNAAQPESPLRIVYSVLLVPPDRFEAGRIQAREARDLYTYLVEPATLDRIGRFGAGASGPHFRPIP